MIEVEYELRVSSWAIKDKLADLVDIDHMSFDIETKGLYGKEQRKEALKLLDMNLDLYTHKLASVVANNSGLSFPSLVETTHFIFGLSESKSIVLVPPNRQSELFIWGWLSKYPGLLLIHNALFDLKVMYHRIKCLPKRYDDTALMLKTLINNSDVWKAKIGLKENMGGFYAPSWALYDEYEPEDSRNPKFLEYASIDGAATFKLWVDIQMHVMGDAWSHPDERDLK
jgi:hypothetical protein